MHGSDEETGDIAVSSWADVVNGSSITVYKPSDFDPENPNLKETGKGDFKETVLKAAIAKAVSNLEQKTSASWDYSRNINWVETVKDIMQSAYSYGDLKGYLRR